MQVRDLIEELKRFDERAEVEMHMETVLQTRHGDWKPTTLTGKALHVKAKGPTPVIVAG
jgi:hypothetical protein